MLPSLNLLNNESNPEAALNCRNSFAASIVLLAVWLVNFNGCTVMGYALGSASDRTSQDSLSVFSWDADKVPEGSQVTVYPKSGKEIVGEFKGVRSVPSVSPAAPSSKIVTVETDAGLTDIDVANIYRINVETPHHGALKGALIGLAADGLAVLYFTSLLSHTHVFF